MADYISRFKDRFSVWWQRLIPLMIIYYMFDLWFRTTSGHFYEVSTIITYVAVPVVAAIIATVFVILTKIFFNPIGLTFLFVVTVGLPYHYFGWWGVFFAFIAFSFVSSIFMDASGGSSSSSSLPYKRTYQDKLDEGSNRAKEIADAEARWQK